MTEEISAQKDSIQNALIFDIIQKLPLKNEVDFIIGDEIGIEVKGTSLV